MKKCWVKIVYFVFLVSLMLPIPAFAVEEIKDQAYDSGIGGASLTLTDSSSTRAQTFSPTLNRLSQVEIYLKDRVAGRTLTIEIIDEPTADVVATANTRMDAGDGWQDVYFGEVAINTNNVYRLKAYSSESLDVKWMYSKFNPYPGGFMYYGANDFDAESDLNFRTYGYNVAAGTETTPVNPSTPGTTTPTSGEALGTTTTSIAKPSSLVAEYSQTDSGVKLSWKASATADIDGYKIFRSESEKTGFTKIKETAKDKLDEVDESVSAGKTYYYQIRAYKGTSQSASSNTATVKVPDTVPPVKPIKLKVVDSTESMIKVTWRKTEDTTVTGYTINLYKQGEKIRTSELQANDELYSFLGLDPLTVYKVELIAKNAKGETSTPAITYGYTNVPEEIGTIMDGIRSLAAILVLILLLILAFRTKKHYHKK